ncbi:hypothetical protein NUW54_g14557 [Trametes sanguinea]|uniref:Uncharacterized protein n=1 Tax=Trametes sanguinea TaxID=158606 RepID=A0ACC1MBH3_9APHY|nr:hypothetical protein NUW54_g14557 [Trametes sanguinea]
MTVESMALNAQVTPLHYDPYYNLYTVYASSDASVHAKHFVLFPPSTSEHLSRANDGSVMRNTSPVELHLRGLGGGEFAVGLDPTSTPARVKDALLSEECALSCVVREGGHALRPAPVVASGRERQAARGRRPWAGVDGGRRLVVTLRTARRRTKLRSPGRQW